MSAPSGKLHRHKDPHLDQEFSRLYRLIQEKKLDERTLDTVKIARQISPRMGIGLGLMPTRMLWGRVNTNGTILDSGSGGWTATSLGTGVLKITPTKKFSHTPFGGANVIGSGETAIEINPLAADDVRFSHPSSHVSLSFWLFV